MYKKKSEVKGKISSYVRSGNKKNYRQEKIAEIIRQEVSMLVLRHIKDPRVGMITISEVTVSKDYKYANVYFGVMGEKDRVPGCLEGLKSASGFIQHNLMKALQMKITPHVRFFYDTSFDYSEKMNKLINEIEKK